MVDNYNPSKQQESLLDSKPQIIIKKKHFIVTLEIELVHNSLFHVYDMFMKFTFFWKKTTVHFDF